MSLLTAERYGTTFGSQQTNMLDLQDAGFSFTPTPPVSGMESFAAGMKTMSPWLAVASAVQGAIGSYYQAKSAQSTLDFQADVAKINARQAEKQAQTILQSGEQQIGQLTMKAGLIKGSQLASQGARGVQIGVGNAAEEVATTDITKETDALTINSNRVRAAAAARAQSTNYANASLLAGTSADSISPMSSAMTSLMTSASSVSGMWYRENSSIERILAAIRGR